MKSTVKILVSVLALSVMASIPELRAQDNSTPPPAGRRGGGRGGRGGMTVDAIEQVVGTLTADQKTKITAILEKAQKDRQDMMSGGGQPDRAKMQELNTTLRKDIRAVLTDEQAKKFDEMPQGGRRGGGRRGGAGGGGAGGAGGAAPGGGN